jgi:hypothetical protein
VRNDGTAWLVIIVEPCLSWLHELRRSDRRTLSQISQAITVLAEGGPGLGGDWSILSPDRSWPT